MVRGWVAIFVMELEHARLTRGNGRLQTSGAYRFFPAMNNKLAVLVKYKPVEPRIYLRQSDGLRILATFEGQSRAMVEAASEKVKLEDFAHQPCLSACKLKILSPNDP